MRCTVLGCKNNNQKKDKKWRFFKFPKQKEICNKWVEFCRRQNQINIKTACICSAHFVPEYFERNLQFEMGLASKNPTKLRPGAIPTIAPNSVFVNGDHSILEENKRKKLIASLLEESTPTAAIFCEVDIKENADNIHSDHSNDLHDKMYIKQEKSGKELVPSLLQEPTSTAAFFCLVDNKESRDDVQSVHTKDLQDEMYFEQEKSEKELVPSLLDQSTSTAAFFCLVDNKDNRNDVQSVHTKDLQVEIENLKRDMFILKENQRIYDAEIKNLKGCLHKAEFERNNMESKLRCIFSEGQVDKLKGGLKQQFWKETDIVKSMNLYSTSAKAYKLLRKNNFPLPAVRTLQSWASKFKISPGITEPVVKIFESRHGAQFNLIQSAPCCTNLINLNRMKKPLNKNNSEMQLKSDNGPKCTTDVAK